MTSYQWKVILALCRLVLNQHGYHEYPNNEGVLDRARDTSTLLEALKREDEDE